MQKAVHQTTTSPATSRWFILLLFVLYIVVLLPLSRDVLRSAYRFTIAIQSQPSSRYPSIWYPELVCRGSFSSTSSPHSNASFPEAVLRDAYLDRRPASLRQAFGKHGPLPKQRVVLAISAHLSVRLEESEATVRLANAPNVRVSIDDVREIESTSKEKAFEYAPGRTTKRGHEVAEWQVIITLRSTYFRRDFEQHLRNLAGDPLVQLKLQLSLSHFDGNNSTFEPRLSLGCIFGWDVPEIIQRHAPADIDRLQQPSSAVLLCANSLSGNKKLQNRSHAEVAHWAARALRGPVRFDIVVLPVIVDISAAECSPNDLHCFEDTSRTNSVLFNSLAKNVAQELQRIGVAEEVFERVVLIPFCRLGAHVLGFEHNNPCSGSQRYGQIQVTFMPYSVLAKYFKVRRSALVPYSDLRCKIRSWVLTFFPDTTNLNSSSGHPCTT